MENQTSKLTTSAKKISAVCSNQEQSQSIPKSKEFHETRKREYQANIKEGDKNCQANMWPVKPAVCEERNVNLPSFTRIHCVLTRTWNDLIHITKGMIYDVYNTISLCCGDYS